MPEFKDIIVETIRYGSAKQHFIEVSKRQIIKEGKEPYTFIQISKGFYKEDGAKLYKKGFGMPVDKELIEQVTAKLTEFAEFTD